MPPSTDFVTWGRIAGAQFERLGVGRTKTTPSDMSRLTHNCLNSFSQETRATHTLAWSLDLTSFSEALVRVSRTSGHEQLPLPSDFS